MNLNEYIREIKDFPKEGILFYDITPLLKDPEAFSATIDMFIEKLEDVDFDYIVAPEARGFLFGSAIAYKMKKGLIPVRKPGKLPYQTRKVEYSLEYGKAGLEIHVDAINPGDKVILLDDVLATGGTISAIADMVEEVGGSVECMLFLMELDFLEARKKLSKYNVQTLLNY